MACRLQACRATAEEGKKGEVRSAAGNFLSIACHHVTFLRGEGRYSALMAVLSVLPGAAGNVERWPLRTTMENRVTRSYTFKVG